MFVLWQNICDEQYHPYLQDKVRNTQPITTTFGSYLPLVMLITWLHSGGILLETFFCQIFFENFECVFSRPNTVLNISQEWLVRLMWNEKEVHRLDTWWTMWPWPLTSLMTLTFDVSRSTFKITLYQGLLSDGCEKSKPYQLDTRLTVWSCPLTTTMALNLTFQGPSFK